MSTRRLTAALVLAGGALLASAPAASAATPDGAWTNPAPVGTAADDIPIAYLEAPHTLDGWAESPNGIAGVTFTLVPDGADRPDDPCSATARMKEPQSAPGGSGRVSFSFAAPFPCNRRYQVRATVAPAQRPLRQETPLVLNLWVAVAIPPAPTTGLAAEVGADRAVSLRWDAAAHEPDFQGYEVRRSTGAEFVPIGEVGPGGRTYVDRAVPPAGGQVRYQVVGLRPGPDAGTTVFADGGAPAEITVAPVPGASSSSTGNDGATGANGAIRPAGSGPVQSVHREFRTPGVARRTTPTTADTGYQETLPFAPPVGDQAVVRIGDDGDSGQRQTLLLVAGGTTAFSWAMALRLLTRRAAGF